MDAMTERRVLGLVGLGVRGRNVVVGVEQVRMAAPDASPHSLKKVLPLLGALGVRVVQGPGAEALGSMVGRESTAAIGIVDHALARGVRNVVDEGASPKGAAAGRGAKGASPRKGDRRNG